MKIMICGKGGCGKSTTTTLLAFAMKNLGKKVLVIDTDESNYGLYRQLGTELPKDFTAYFGGRRGVLDRPKTKIGDSFLENKWKISDIPEEYLSDAEGIKLMAIGKIQEAGEGCACAMGVLARCFFPMLEEGEDEIVLIDAEAGVEHFGRGVDHTVDQIVMIMDPSFESIQLSEKIYTMSQSIGKPVHYILNKVGDGQSDMMLAAMAHRDLVLGVLPMNMDIAMRGLKGEKLDSPFAEIEEIAGKLLDVNKKLC